MINDVKKRQIFNHYCECQKNVVFDQIANLLKINAILGIDLMRRCFIRGIHVYVDFVKERKQKQRQTVASRMMFLN